VPILSAVTAVIAPVLAPITTIITPVLAPLATLAEQAGSISSIS
jgi:hypothetical protein